MYDKIHYNKKNNNNLKKKQEKKKKQQLERDTEQWTGSKLGKEYIGGIYCHFSI